MRPSTSGIAKTLFQTVSLAVRNKIFAIALVRGRISYIVTEYFEHTTRYAHCAQYKSFVKKQLQVSRDESKWAIESVTAGELCVLGGSNSGEAT